MTASLQRMLKKVPVVGGMLAKMAAFAPYSAFGALGVEPTMIAAKFLGPYLPQVPASVFYAGTGLLVAALIQNFLPVAPATRAKLAIAVASAAGGVGYYKWRTGQDTDVATETGALMLSGVGSWADGLAYKVAPNGYGSTLIYGR